MTDQCPRFGTDATTTPRSESQGRTRARAADGSRQVLEDVAEEDGVELAGEFLAHFFQGRRQDAVADARGLRGVRGIRLDADDARHARAFQGPGGLPPGASDVQNGARPGRQLRDEVLPRLAVHLAVAVEIGARIDEDAPAGALRLLRHLVQGQSAGKAGERPAPDGVNGRPRGGGRARGGRLRGDIPRGLLEERRRVVGEREERIALLRSTARWSRKDEVPSDRLRPTRSDARRRGEPGRPPGPPGPERPARLPGRPPRSGAAREVRPCRGPAGGGHNGPPAAPPTAPRPGIGECPPGPDRTPKKNPWP